MTDAPSDVLGRVTVAVYPIHSFTSPILYQFSSMASALSFLQLVRLRQERYRGLLSRLFGRPLSPIITFHDPVAGEIVMDVRCVSALTAAPYPYLLSQHIATAELGELIEGEKRRVLGGSGLGFTP